MCLFIGKCMEIVWIQDPVGAVQELGGFKYHLDDMLVARILGSFARQHVEVEDVHLISLDFGPVLFVFNTDEWPRVP
jgi:hypothetical protein